MAKPNHSDYTVGYKKPPRHNRFKPGHSGNPTGRPKKTVTPGELIEQEGQMLITITENHKPIRVSKLHAMVKGLFLKGTTGNSRAAELVFQRLEQHQSDGPDNLEALIDTLRTTDARIESGDQGLPNKTLAPVGGAKLEKK